MMTERDIALIDEMKSHIGGIYQSRADMIDEHLVFVKVVTDAIERGILPPMPIEVADKMKFVHASEAMRDHVLKLVRCFVEFTTNAANDRVEAEKKEVAK